MFQQNNDPPHKLNKNMALLTNSLSLFNCPPYSPGANPIENLWAFFKSKVAKRSPKNLAHLEEVVEMYSKTILS